MIVWAWGALRELAGSVRDMRRTGRWAKLPVRGRGAAAELAAALNELIDTAQELKRRLHTQRVELRELQEELDQVLHLKDDFLVTVNHQFRTPLTTLIEGIELLADGVCGPASADQRGLLDAMLENAKRLHALTEEVLDLGRLKSGRVTLDRRPTDLEALLLRTAEAWEPLGDGRRVRVFAGRLPPVYMDAEAIGRVLDHLLRNALRNAPEGSEVTVEAEARDGLAEVCIRDRGPGLSPAQVERLFQPFVHLHTPDAPGAEGSGLGLAFCAQVIRRHRGTIRAESSPQAGMAVTFTLPVASETFLLEEACRMAQEDAKAEDGSFGLLLVTPAPEAQTPGEPEAQALRRLDTLLHCHTHRGDRFVTLAGLGLGIVAVLDERGLQAMSGRLCSVLRQAGLAAHLGCALAPVDGASAEQLLRVARQRLSAARPEGGELAR
jgi:signal transduction histidine kinase